LSFPSSVRFRFRQALLFHLNSRTTRPDTPHELQGSCHTENEGTGSTIDTIMCFSINDIVEARFLKRETLCLLRSRLQCENWHQGSRSRNARAQAVAGTRIELFTVRVGTERDAGGYVSLAEKPQNARPGLLHLAESRVVPFVGIRLTGGIVVPDAMFGSGSRFGLGGDDETEEHTSLVVGDEDATGQKRTRVAADPDVNVRMSDRSPSKP
jgi:hypothetical protein